VTEDDAIRIEDAAIVLLRTVQAAGFGSADVRAALKWLPAQGSVSLRSACELLEATDAWKAAKGREVNDGD
jgi:hypothetical protein